MQYKVTDETTYDELKEAVQTAYGAGQGVSFSGVDGYNFYTVDAVIAMAEDPDVMDSMMSDHYKHKIPVDEQTTIRHSEVNDMYREQLRAREGAENEAEAEFDDSEWDEAELPHDIDVRANELKIELEELLEKGDLKGFLSKFDDAVIELSDMSADVEIGFWKDALEGRLGDKLERPVEEIRESMSNATPDWQNLSYLQPEALKQAMDLGVNNEFASNAADPAAPSADVVLNIKPAEPAALA
jgi:hypothetical protein